MPPVYSKSASERVRERSKENLLNPQSLWRIWISTSHPNEYERVRERSKLHSGKGASGLAFRPECWTEGAHMNWKCDEQANHGEIHIFDLAQNFHHRVGWNRLGSCLFSNTLNITINKTPTTHNWKTVTALHSLLIKGLRGTLTKNVPTFWPGLGAPGRVKKFGTFASWKSPP